jgi:hypothetical protein
LRFRSQYWFDNWFVFRWHSLHVGVVLHLYYRPNSRNFYEQIFLYYCDVLFAERLCSPVGKKLAKQFMDSVDSADHYYIRVRSGVLTVGGPCGTPEVESFVDNID